MPRYQYKIHFLLLTLPTLLLTVSAFDGPPLKAGSYNSPPKGGGQGAPALYSCPPPYGADQYIPTGLCKKDENCTPTEAVAKAKCLEKGPTKIVTKRTCLDLPNTNNQKACWVCCRKAK